MKSINIAIAGVGNCASSLVQGLEYYRHQKSPDTAGLMHANLGGYTIESVKVVAAFDIDKRKVGKPLEQAIFAKPNNTAVFQAEVPASGVTVQMGPVHDGLAELGPTLGELRALVRDLRRISERLDSGPTQYLLGRDAPKEFEPK